ncbi:2-C-methyl-D-erythritol 4-phosphate cytidylyltransferase [Acinetobacter sp. ACNIH2]|uniref:2-C-methyl-D-erythritol 4-phosphate cytidylyltransferase n=1 Tax=Acinetobacter sp. ACNIH2 TaxID=1758189 RepID=UPI000CDC1E07|nr:2-C-methyl-D-erythritol 4-phosphate cytidylyltransferase [Acinetobacter sp. ACNIH2]AUX87620.1 2-C-methyl-D-erythritol 4-phosphate cytidylyltransferase [Acinetobacter sp. ACNIH2]
MPSHQSQLMTNKLWVVIPAAGSGRRFSQSELKQYQLLDHKTVLEHTVERLNGLALAGYVLAVAQDDNIISTLALAVPEKSHFCIGGNERVDSVLNALTYLTQIADKDDWVLVHDAARPCVTLPVLNTLVHKAIETDQAAILAIPVRDTLKRVETEAIISQTVSRDLLWQAQTPQMAKLGVLKQAIELALQDQQVITDEASALEYAGHPVQVVHGRSDNIKITYPDDLQLARLIIQSQS